MMLLYIFTKWEHKLLLGIVSTYLKKNRRTYGYLKRRRNDMYIMNCLPNKLNWNLSLNILIKQLIFYTNCFTYLINCFLKIYAKNITNNFHYSAMVTKLWNSCFHGVSSQQVYRHNFYLCQVSNENRYHFNAWMNPFQLENKTH